MLTWKVRNAQSFRVAFSFALVMTQDAVAGPFVPPVFDELPSSSPKELDSYLRDSSIGGSGISTPDGAPGFFGSHTSRCKVVSPCGSGLHSLGP